MAIQSSLAFFGHHDMIIIDRDTVSFPPDLQKTLTFHIYIYIYFFFFSQIFPGTKFLCLVRPTVAFQCFGAGFSFLSLAWSVQFLDWMLGCSREKLFSFQRQIRFTVDFHVSPFSLFNFVLVDSSFEVQLFWKQDLRFDFEKLHDGWVKRRRPFLVLKGLWFAGLRPWMEPW